MKKKYRAVSLVPRFTSARGFSLPTPTANPVVDRYDQCIDLTLTAPSGIRIPIYSLILNEFPNEQNMLSVFDIQSVLTFFVFLFIIICFNPKIGSFQSEPS